MTSAEISAAVTELERQVNTRRAEITTLEQGIDALRLLCAHSFAPAGHGHNYAVERCQVCGLERES